MLTGSARSMMQKTQESSMQHMCTIELYIVDEDGSVSYGAPSAPVRCGFKALAGYESHGDLYEAVTADAEIRFPLGVRVGLKDRITITESFGKPVFPRIRYEVSRLPDSFGPSGQVAELTEIYS